MIIENPDAFKSWLTSILEPLCDADPAALAKYVYALVKKDKPFDELREGMLDQLDVFLQHETKPFVDMLFKALESNEYLKLQAENQPPLPKDLSEPDKENEVETNREFVVQSATNGAAAEPSLGGGTGARSPTAGGAPRHRVVVSRAPAKVAAPAPPAPPAPPLPRAPPLEHTLIKVSQPLTELLEEPVDQPIRRRDRRGDGLRDKDDRRRRRSRSWERPPRPRGGRRHPDADVRRYDKSRRPSSRSPSPRGRYRNRSPPPNTALDRAVSRSRSRSPVPVREREHERERDRLRIPREIERDRMSRDREHLERITRSRDRDRSRDRSLDRGSRSVSPNDRLEPNDAFKRRCRDFDEKGYCMRGDLCQWDHGTDPVVLEDSTLGVLSMPPPVPEYNPLTPDIWSGSMPPYHPLPFGHPPPHPHHPHPPRALIPVRIRDVPPPPGTMPLGIPSIPPPRHPMPKKNFDYNRLGPSRAPPQGYGGNCSLEVKKVPRGLNDITHLNNHFGKFGKIVNIQVCFEGDPEAALITFSNHTEASVAYKSTEAVLNNRFIKVFWHNHENKSENIAPSGQANKQAGLQHPASLNKVLINRDNIKATPEIKQQPEKPKTETANGQEPAKEAPKPVEKSKQVMEMHKRAQALLQTQLQQQVLLIERLESGNVTGAQKTALMEAISSAQEGIEKLRKELVAYNKTLKQMQANAKKPKTREEAQKEILDAELDMFNKQQEGHDVTDLLKKITDLRRQMAIQFPVHQPLRRTITRGGRFNSAMRYTRGAPPQKVFINQTVDHRPRVLLISGFETDELDSLVTHFSQFGEVTGKEVNLAVPELTLQYKARQNAEQAMLKGKNYNDRTLSITWVTNNKTFGNNNNNAAQSVNGEANAAASKEPEQSTQDVSEDVLLRFDEEEDEDSEDRSWRR